MKYGDLRPRIYVEIIFLVHPDSGQITLQVWSWMLVFSYAATQMQYMMVNRNLNEFIRDCNIK